MNDPTFSPLRDHYDQLVASGTIEADPAQEQAIASLSALEIKLDRYKPASKSGLIGRFFGDTEPPRGLYIHGDVGRGKTMLMDLFFQHSRVAH